MNPKRNSSCQTHLSLSQAMRAGKLIKLHGIEFDEAHASVLKRAVRTLWTALHSSGQHWLPVKHTWRLNERHYGALTGLSKKDAAAQLGDEMLQRYRRGFDVPPLPMDEDHPCWTGNDRRCAPTTPLPPLELAWALKRYAPLFSRPKFPQVQRRGGRDSPRRVVEAVQGAHLALLVTVEPRITNGGGGASRREFFLISFISSSARAFFLLLGASADSAPGCSMVHR